MSPDDPMMIALEAVRRETTALIAAHEAKVDGVLNQLTTKMDANQQAHEMAMMGVRGSIERLTDQVGKVAACVSGLQDDDNTAVAVQQALGNFKASMTRRLYAAATLAVMALGAIAAFLH